ncbi:hypothetical protein MATL_G00155500 [Megalops atlanticus]|uniref:Uncharacterized protein n=1 Tax=Megalops atlanticus TaxID=7932 RepID=A0A9D3PPQ1_MEGAT|nr:hypothetical protein MATL_G00155500 [Megalops atlanticus]
MKLESARRKSAPALLRSPQFAAQSAAVAPPPGRRSAGVSRTQPRDADRIVFVFDWFVRTFSSRHLPKDGEDYMKLKEGQ